MRDVSKKKKLIVEGRIRNQNYNLKSNKES
jgi:hypothetical protein